ncbi:cadherin-like beta sandwich domain-containing protein [Odoribacter sp. OttesenSCG-928-J03]|nr:cadherin-like beta sandwich domain-containing protein [Odoribacter sp. OttesenSCG-928-J03]
MTKGVYRVEITHPDLSELTKVVASYIVGTVPTDQFTFTWEGGVDKEFEVSLKDHNSFIVDWGDGSDPETYINLSVQETSVKHAYSDARPYTVTVTGIKPDCFFKSVNVGGYSVTALDVTALPALLTLECYGNRLTELDLSKNTMLTELNCQANKLTALDINKNKKLVRLKCYDNAIPLVDMKAASNRIDIAYYKQLGTQTLPGVSVSVGSSVVIDSVYNGTGTTFTVTKDFGKPLVEGNDYTLESGVITFLSNGIYTVKLTNLAITSNSEKPAQVVYNYFVGTESKQQLTFTWRGSVKAKKMNIRLNHGNEIEVNWGDGTVENYIHTHTAANNAESFYIIPAHTYNDLKIYTVTLTGLTSDCFFQCFWMYDTSVVSLDINAPSLRELLCEPSQLTQLDVSNNPALIFLSCRGSQLTSLNITEAPQLRSLYCEGNRLTELDLTHLPELEDLACQNNRLLNLNLSHNPALNFLHCQNNAISLAGLKGISDKMGNNPNCRLGTQTIPDINVARGRAVPMDTVFYGNGTVFTVSRQDGTVAENADYTIKNGKITFLSEGTYTVEISNPAIDLYYNSAKVVATYHVRTLDSDASLKSLNVSDGTLAPTFVAETVNYTVNVGYEVESITITATPTHESATVSGDLDKYTLLVGENILKITVTAEDGVTEKVYTVKVVRANKDNNAFLSFTTFTAANGALSSPYRIISLSFGYTGDSPTHYMVSERADFSGAVWEIYVDEPFYTFITDAYGEKTLYAKLKNTVTPETKVLSTSLYYKAGPEKRPLDAFGTRVYPNPVVNNLNVSMEGEEQSAEVTIYTITGSVWQHRSYQGQQFTIDLSNAPSGVLLVKISNREGEVIKRILKQ